MSFVMEYNIEAFERKFHNTLCMVDINGRPNKIFVNTVGYDGEGDICFFDGNEERPVPARPIYHHFKAGYYLNGNHWHCLTRKPVQSFKIGLSKDGYYMDYFHEGKGMWSESMSRLSNMSLDVKANPQSSVDKFGPISDRFFVSPSKIYYLTTPIGFREGNMFYLADDALKQEVSDALRGLTFEGKPCQVNNV